MTRATIDTVNQKTNAMRQLDRLGIPYDVRSYIRTDAVNGMEVAIALNEDPAQVFKTLVTMGRSKRYYVFMLPVDRELDLKKAAASVNEKSVDMIRSRDLLQLTGYIHGGCSPLCMKRPFRTVIDSSAESQKIIFFSAGKIGYQIGTEPANLRRVIGIETADIVKESSLTDQVIRCNAARQ
ncbi:MAG: aminoacyl-tRNA deacylase [Candidatus Methanomethylophilaceae archaeon]